MTALLAKMTLEEKIGQLRMRQAGVTAAPADALDAVAKGQVGAMVTAPGVPRKHLRALQDATIRRSRLRIPLFFAADVIHGQRTIFPIGLGLASSWDLEHIALSARVSAKEATADGLDMTFAPMVDISRDPRWGRISESSGEDTYLSARIAGTVVRALQGPSLGATDSLMACVKHFAGYGAVEGGRDYNTTDMSLQRLFQDFLPPYKAAVDAGAGAIMTALTTLNGVPATANHWLLRKVLREAWQFDGLVISDDGAVENLIDHGTAANGNDAARSALMAGTQISMNDRYFGQTLPQLVKQGAIPMEILDEAVLQILTTKYDLGLFADPYRRLRRHERLSAPEPPLHRTEAREVARRSLVLLKNHNGTLPLARRGTIALIGPLADNTIDILGSWSGSGQPEQAVSLYKGMKKILGGQARLLYAKGANIADDPRIFELLADNRVSLDPRPPSELLAQAVAVANQADVIVAALGESRGMSHEAASRTDLRLESPQRTLLQALKQTGKPLVLVLMNGRPLTIEKESEMADAVLETWFSGTEGGNAIADVLFGDYNPSGKLPVTFPRSVGQIPIYYNNLNTGRPFNRQSPAPYRSHYFDIDDSPLYPFGHGLSYTDFHLSGIRLQNPQMVPGKPLHASITLSNRGARSGATVVQLYLRDAAASVSRPVKELKGFQKVSLAPGASRTIGFDIDASMLTFYDADLQLVSEPGWFEVMIGLDSEHVQRARFELLPGTTEVE